LFLQKHGVLVELPVLVINVTGFPVCFIQNKMAASAVQAEMAEVSCSSLGKNLLIGTTIGIGIGIGVGTVLFVVRRVAKPKNEDKEMLICMQQLTQEMKELRLVLTKQKQARISEQLIVPVKETKITENKSSSKSLRSLFSLTSDDDEEFFDVDEDDDMIIPVQQTETVMQRFVYLVF